VSNSNLRPILHVFEIWYGPIIQGEALNSLLYNMISRN